VALGETAQFDVTATGTAPLCVYWQHGSKRTPVVSEMTLAVKALSTDDAGDYQAVVQGPVDSATSDTATLTIGSHSGIELIIHRP